MKASPLLLLLAALIGLSGCQTYTLSNGQTRTGLSPTGAALAQLGVATAIGVGTGALMKKSPSWATGGVSGAAGSVGSQLLNALVPQAPAQYQQVQQYPVQYQQPVRYQQPVYQQGYPQVQPQYVRLQNGQIVRIQ
ncbi:MAG: hypothetical protein IAE94_09565 [Chthoniobacterales bacterium]|nr:hypothetical protein [Chthoniobacterales bacterium]